MPITDRDRKTLIIGGSVLGFFLVAFLIYKLFLSGGADGAATITPTFSPVSPITTTSPTASPTPSRVSVVTFGGRDPFCISQSYVSRETLLHLQPDASAYYCPGVYVPSATPSASSTPSGSASASATASSTVASSPIASSAVIGGRSVVLMAAPAPPGSRTPVEVNGKVYNVAVGSTFGGGSFRLQSISGTCASFLYGDQPFSLCHT